MSLTLQEAIRIQAFDTVVNNPTNEYQIRHVMRWWSKQFHTPLKDVENIPLEEIIRDYFEVKYEEMDEVDREEERYILTTEEKERENAARAEEEEVNRLLEEAASENQVIEKVTENPPPPPEIKMTFVDDNLVGDDFERFNTMNPVRKSIRPG